MNQARGTYPGGMSELVPVLHLRTVLELHRPDED